VRSGARYGNVRPHAGPPFSLARTVGFPPARFPRFPQVAAGPVSIGQVADPASLLWLARFPRFPLPATRELHKPTSTTSPKRTAESHQRERRPTANDDQIDDEKERQTVKLYPLQEFFQ